MPPTLLDSITVPDDPELIRYLEDLGLRPEKTHLLFRDDCQEAGLSFEFFQAFSRLTTQSDSPLFGSPITRLLGTRPKSLDTGGPEKSTKQILDEMMAANAQQRGLVFAGQALDDHKIDPWESDLLKLALRALTEDRTDVITAKTRINELGARKHQG